MQCKNCFHEIKDEINYCERCGAKVIRNRINLKNLWQDFTEQFLNYDNKFLKTFLHLFTKPGAVIGGYINGVRKRYVNVLSYFAIAISLSGLQIFLLKRFYPELLDFSTLAASEAAAQQSQAVWENMTEFQSLVMFLYIPIYAVMAKIVFWGNKKFNYTELFVIFMYINSQLSILGVIIFLISALLGVPIGVMGLVILPIQVVYAAWCLKQLYELDLANIILRTLIFFIVGFVMLIVFVVLYYGGIYLLEGKEGVLEVIEAQRPKKSG